MTTCRLFIYNNARRAQKQRQRAFLRRLFVGVLLVAGWLTSALIFGG